MIRALKTGTDLRRSVFTERRTYSLTRQSTLCRMNPRVCFTKETRFLCSLTWPEHLGGALFVRLLSLAPLSTDSFYEVDYGSPWREKTLLSQVLSVLPIPSLDQAEHESFRPATH